MRFLVSGGVRARIAADGKLTHRLVSVAESHRRDGRRGMPPKEGRGAPSREGIGHREEREGKDKESRHGAGCTVAEAMGEC